MNRRLNLAALAAAAAITGCATAVTTAALPAGATETCAVSVAGYRTSTPGDDTPAFRAAIADAVSQHANCYAQGPSGQPQSVVYVPAGTYRIAGLTFPSNVRMEVDAGATLELPADRATVPVGGNVSMFLWDSVSKVAPALNNVSLVGVGSTLTPQKQTIAAAGGSVMAPFAVAGDFTMNLDPAATGSTNYNTGIELVNVQHFDIENLLTVQNATNQPSNNLVAWPTSARAVIRLHARSNSPVHGPTFMQPKYGTIHNQVNVNSPRGYGPNQVNGAQYVTFSDIYTSGGTGLRLETDGSTSNNGTPRIGATVDHVVGRNIVGVNCNRAVSLSPHGQHNGTVDIEGVWAYSCNQAVVAAFDQGVLPQYYGRFDDATVGDLHVVGAYSAQLDSTVTLWVTGESLSQYYVAPGLPWLPKIQLVAQSGSFSRSVV